MVHHRERLPLGLEACDDALRFHAELDDFQRDAAADRLLLFGEIDNAAAAFADFLREFVAADARADFFLAERETRSGAAVRAARRVQRRARNRQRRAAFGEEPIGFGRDRQQALEARTEGGVTAAGL